MAGEYNVRRTAPQPLLGASQQERTPQPEGVRVAQPPSAVMEVAQLSNPPGTVSDSLRRGPQGTL